MASTALQVYQRLVRYAAQHWVWFVLGLLGTVIESLVTAGFTWVMKPLLDKGFVGKDPVFIHWLPAGIIFAFVIRGLAGFMSNYYMALTGREVVSRFRQDMFAHLLKLPARFFDHHSSGQLLSRLLYSVEQLAKASTDAIVTLVQETCLIIGLIAVMFSVSWRLSLLFLIAAPIVAGIARYSSRRMRRLGHHVQDSMGEVTQIAQEGIEGYKVIRIYGGESYEIEKFNRMTAKNRSRELKIIATNTLASYAVQQIAGFIIALMVYFATAKSAHITAGGFTAMLASMLALLKPMRNLTTVNNVIQKGVAAADNIFSLLDEPAEKDIGQQELGQTIRGEIEYRNVSFAYKDHKLVLKNISFKAEPGQIIALVGRSGSGKTTLVSLLPRFYDEYQGEISIDGQDIRNFSLRSLRSQFALVSQQVTLFNDTIGHNIAYGASDHASELEIKLAAQAAHAWEFIEKLPDGLNTVIGENGVLLSGGQRQRIAIARAILKKAPILILDEATSALDTESEQHIQAALEELMSHQITTLVIAHRLSTIKKAHQILVLEDGALIEQGTHQTLLNQRGRYAHLYQLQFAESY